MNEPLNERDREVQEAANEVAARVQSHVDENLALGGCCDFCSELLDEATRTTWVTDPIMATTTMIDEETLGAGSIINVMSADWAACARCDPVVAERDPERLADHVIAHRGSRAIALPPELLEQIRADLADLYRKFYESGPVRQGGER